LNKKRDTYAPPIAAAPVYEARGPSERGSRRPSQSEIRKEEVTGNPLWAFPPALAFTSGWP